MNEFLAGILSGINTVVNNYGWSIVVFTLLIKLILFPLDYRSRKSMRRMSSLQPQIARLQTKYANDKEKLNQKTAELYRKEKINPLSSCLPMLLSFPVLIWMFAAMRVVANTALANQAIDFITTGQQTNESWLWVKNLWMPDSPFATMIADQMNLKQIPADIWTKVFAALPQAKLDVLAGLNITAETINGDTIFTVLSQSATYEAEMARWATLPELNLLITKLPIYANINGWFLLPVLASVTQFLMSATQQTTPTEGANAGTGKFMKYFFPIFSLYICSSYNAGFSLYWVASNLIAWGQTVVLNKYFDAKEQKAKEAVGEGTVK